MRYKKTFYMFLISLILLNFSIIYATNINEYNLNNYFRVHIVANSDSIDDQLLKYTVAKEVNAYIGELTKNVTSKEESKKLIEENIQKILELCSNIIQKENYNYSVTAHIGKIKYSEKNKENIQMNEGVYDSLKIVIGNGSGENWWSLIYPTSLQTTTLEQAFDENTTYSFGIIEIIQNLFK